MRSFVLFCASRCSTTDYIASSIKKSGFKNHSVCADNNRLWKSMLQKGFKSASRDERKGFVTVYVPLLTWVFPSYERTKAYFEISAYPAVPSSTRTIIRKYWWILSTGDHSDQFDSIEARQQADHDGCCQLTSFHQINSHKIGRRRFIQ
jgi:hypothetical protein